MHHAELADRFVLHTVCFFLVFYFLLAVAALVSKIRDLRAEHIEARAAANAPPMQEGSRTQDFTANLNIAMGFAPPSHALSAEAARINIPDMDTMSRNLVLSWLERLTQCKYDIGLSMFTLHQRMQMCLPFHFYFTAMFGKDANHCSSPWKNMLDLNILNYFSKYLRIPPFVRENTDEDVLYVVNTQLSIELLDSIRMIHKIRFQAAYVERFQYEHGYPPSFVQRVQWCTYYDSMNHNKVLSKVHHNFRKIWSRFLHECVNMERMHNVLSFCQDLNMDSSRENMKEELLKDYFIVIEAIMNEVMAIYFRVAFEWSALDLTLSQQHFSCQGTVWNDLVNAAGVPCSLQLDRSTIFEACLCLKTQVSSDLADLILCSHWGNHVRWRLPGTNPKLWAKT